MKAERRHELKENDFAHLLVQARDYVDANSKTVGLWLLFIAVIVVGGTIAIRARSAATNDLWAAKAALSFETPELAKQEALPQLQNLIRKASDDVFLLEALVDQARHALRLSNEVPDPPDRELNEMAESALKQLHSDFASNPLALGYALNALATVEENKFTLDRDLSHKDAAREYLQKVVDTAALNGMPYQRMALDRLDRLDSIFSRVDIAFPAAPPVNEDADDSAAPDDEGEGAAEDDGGTDTP